MRKKMRRLQHISTIPLLAALLLTSTPTITRQRDDTGFSQVDTSSETTDIIDTFKNRQTGS